MSSRVRTALWIFAAVLLGFVATYLVLNRQEDSLASPAEETSPGVPEVTEKKIEGRTRDDHPRRGSPELSAE